MEQYLESIAISLNTENYFSALALALMMPDICSAIESKNNKGSGKLYSEWFDKYLSHYYTDANYFTPPMVFLSGKECYALRCSYLHQGMHEIGHQSILEREENPCQTIQFVAKGMPQDKLKLGSLVLLNLNNFCQQIISAVETWLKDNSENQLVNTRLQMMPRIETQAFTMSMPEFDAVESK